ncbi:MULTISPECIES: P-loop NTPase fold protein [Acinetobacter]|uniref:KAP family P-loop domain protein n=1 Tax=Acinetobacter chengduensis TaxID=2420890 RepID=A0ABX9TWN2_9GAMM|nr:MULTISPECIES: P-loop NTPase fold protein [Acinetobacter]MBI1452110.1 KAP family P-loop domain protein [Acinetobacter sp. FL51]RKG41650.1 KAP family P-loop domain protein [Acinetobacter sp. WCHAc060007]RLL22476.1 KAP family P-loop domain protein [Acinetobacter chengduensis]
MNQSQEQRLEEIFRKNENNGIAIAIIGCWGVGKTFAWNKFLETRAKEEEEKIKHLPAFKRNNDQKVFSKKYAYISLFGIENLSDLKVAISTNMSSNYFNQESSKNFEIPAFIKKGLTALREVKLTSSEYGVSSSARIFESMLYAQVKDAIICFDDFERMSKKLDIKDVMGLANQLKLEKNCQIILILDEDKAEGENKKKYAEYKEKLIDETIKITSVEPLIRENAKDIDEPLVGLMVKFADELDIHNFRFFQKVIKLYHQFLEELPNKVVTSTKEIILIRVLVGYFLELFGQSQKIDWVDIKNGEEKLDNEKLEIYKKLRNISYSTVRADPLFLEFEKIFQQVGSYDSEILIDIVKKEWLRKENLNKIQKIEFLTEKYYEESFTKADLDNLIGLIKNDVNLFSGYQLKKIIEFLCDENKEEIISLIKIYIKRLYLADVKTKAQLKEEYGKDFEIYIDLLDEKKIDIIIDDKVTVLYKAITSGFDKNTSDPEILDSFSKADWNSFLGESRGNIFPEKYKFDNFNRILRAVRWLFDNQFISEECLKQIEVNFGAVLTDLESVIGEKDPKEIRLRFSHWKEKLKLD